MVKKEHAAGLRAGGGGGAKAVRVQEAKGYVLALSAKSKTGYRGVHKNKIGRYMAQRNQRYLGTFATAVAAAAVAYAKDVAANPVERPENLSWRRRRGTRWRWRSR